MTMREKLASFMAGRNGTDQLNLFLLGLTVVLLLISTFFSRSFGRYLYPVILLLLVITNFRSLSKNVVRRREENGKFIRAKYSFDTSVHVHRERWIQRRDYKFFTCPSCHTTLRVPRGNGKIKIVCRKCGISFMGKS